MTYIDNVNEFFKFPYFHLKIQEANKLVSNYSVDNLNLLRYNVDKTQRS